jgi:hypothetical protein
MRRVFFIRRGLGGSFGTVYGAGAPLTYLTI